MCGTRSIWLSGLVGIKVIEQQRSVNTSVVSIHQKLITP
jgi:hypothetical protein